MTRNTSRTSQTRETNTRDETEYVFEEPNAIEIPKEIEDKFNSEGMSLKWIRIDLNGNEDYRNVGKHQQEGWIFVTPEEVPEMGATSVVRKEGRYAGVVCRGDVALGKIPTNRVIAKKKYFKKKADDLMNAVNSQLMSQNNSRMPISNTSKTQTIKGRTPRFQE